MSTTPNSTPDLQDNLPDDISESLMSYTPFISGFGCKMLKPTDTAQARCLITGHPYFSDFDDSSRYSFAPALAVLDQLAATSYFSQQQQHSPMATLSLSATFSEPALITEPLILEADYLHSHDSILHIAIRAMTQHGVHLTGSASYLVGALPGTVAEMMSASEQEPLNTNTSEDVPAHNLQASSFSKWLQLNASSSSPSSSSGSSSSDTQLIMVGEYSAGFIGAVTFPALHGGYIAGAIYEAGKYFAEQKGYTSTTNMQIDYLRSGKTEDIVLECKHIFASNRALTLQVVMSQQQGKRLVAQAQMHFIR